jgi:hypothetical protein
MVEDGEPRGGDGLPDGLEGATGETAGGLPWAKQIAGAQKLGAEASLPPDPPGHESRQDQQAEAACRRLLGTDRRPGALGDGLDPYRARRGRLGQEVGGNGLPKVWFEVEQVDDGVCLP